jgi:hypothetical protein
LEGNSILGLQLDLDLLLHAGDARSALPLPSRTSRLGLVHQALQLPPPLREGHGRSGRRQQAPRLGRRRRRSSPQRPCRIQTLLFFPFLLIR